MKKLLISLTIVFLTQFTLLHGSPNLLRNSSFEEGLNADGLPCYWRFKTMNGSQTRVELSDQHVTEGKNSLHIIQEQPRGMAYLFQVFTLKPNTDYILEAKGFRTIPKRWHYISIYIPGSINESTRIPFQGGNCPPIIFTSDSQKLRGDVKIGAWSINSQQPQSARGELWVDEISLRELSQNPARWNSLPRYAFPGEKISVELLSRKFKGQVALTLTDRQQCELLEQKIDVVPGKNSHWFTLPEKSSGVVRLTALSSDQTIRLTHYFIILNNTNN